MKTEKARDATAWPPVYQMEAQYCDGIREAAALKWLEGRQLRKLIHSGRNMWAIHTNLIEDITLTS